MNKQARGGASFESAKSHPWYGALWKIAAFGCYAGLNAIARYLSGGAQTALDSHLPVYMVIFFQDLFALVLLLFWLSARRERAPRLQHVFLHFLRACVSVIAIVTWYFALTYMPLAQAVSLSIMGPIVGIVAAKCLLKEHFSWSRGAIVLLSVLVTWLVIKPQTALKSDPSYVGLLFIVLSSFSFAFAKIITRKLAQLGETPQILTFSLLLFIAPLSLLPALFQWVTPTWVHWPWLLAAGGLMLLAIYCVSTALVYAEVSFLALFDLCRLFINGLVGYIAFTELPATWAIWPVLALVAFSIIARKRVE